MYLSEMCTISLCLPSLSLQVSGTLQPCWGHSTTAFCLVDGVTEVTMFGGSTHPPSVHDEKLPKLSDTTLLQFCKHMNMFTHRSAYVFNSTVFIMLIIISNNCDNELVFCCP